MFIILFCYIIDLIQCMEPKIHFSLDKLSISEKEKTDPWLIVIIKKDLSQIWDSHKDSLFIEKIKKSLLDDQCHLLTSGQNENQIILTTYCKKEEEEEEEQFSETLPYLNKIFQKTNVFIERDKTTRIKKSPYLQIEKEKIEEGYIGGWYGGGDGDHLISDIARYKTHSIYNYNETLIKNIHQLNNVQSFPPWHLDRIDQRYGSLDNQYHYINTASNINIYFIDTGIRVTHTEFQGRAIFLANTIGDGINTDCVGHGTHVAALAGGLTYGVAKGARLFGIKSLDCNGDGTVSSILMAIQTIIEHNNATNSNKTKRVVVNLSLGGDKSTVLDSAILSLTQRNFVVVVAGGNEGSDASLFSPSNLGLNNRVLSVGASDINDVKPSWSNYGEAISVTAPGVTITSAWYTSDSATHILSGTSMATPIVAGVAAIILQENLNLTVTQTQNILLSWGTPHIVSHTTVLGGGANLLYSLININEIQPTQAPTTTTHAPTLNSSSNNMKYSHSIIIYLVLLVIMINNSILF